MMKSKSSKKMWILGSVGVMVLVGISAAVLLVIDQLSPKVYFYGYQPPPIFWEQPAGGLSAKNAAGSFGIKAFVIFNPKIFIFYAFQPADTDIQPSGQLELAQITAFSTEGNPLLNHYSEPGETPLTLGPNPDAGKTTPLKVTGLQPIGTFGNTAVGMITLEVPDQSDQRISLKITAPGDPQTFWEVTPLHQTYPMRGSTSHFTYTDLDNNAGSGPFYTEVRVESSGVGGINLLGVFDVFSSGTSTSRLHLQLDVQGI